DAADPAAAAAQGGGEGEGPSGDRRGVVDACAYGPFESAVAAGSDARDAAEGTAGAGGDCAEWGGGSGGGPGIFEGGGAAVVGVGGGGWGEGDGDSGAALGGADVQRHAPWIWRVWAGCRGGGGGAS